MKRSISAIVGMSFLAAALPAAAQYGSAGVSQPDVEARQSAAYRRCIDAGGGPREMSVCTQEEHRLQDARLNRTYRATMARLNANGRSRLRDEQRSWLHERDRQCDAYERELEGGTMQIYALGACETRWAVARTIWLERYRQR